MTDELYKIGAVSKLTNITVECLRAWERRYGLTPAQRAGKTRYYSKPQVERLSRIKALLDQGHPISQLIKLSDAEIDDRLSIETRVEPRHAGATVALVGVDLIIAERADDEHRLDVRGRWPNIESFEAELEFAPAVATVVVLSASLDPAAISHFQQKLPQTHVVWAYRFATQTDLEAATAAGATLVRWPAAWSEVASACQPGHELQHAEAECQRRFSDDELLHLTSAAAGAACECACSLVDLINQLNAFASHASRCGVQRGAESAHRQIGLDAERARAQLELSLAALAEQHGLMLGDDAPAEPSARAPHAAAKSTLDEPSTELGARR